MDNTSATSAMVDIWHTSTEALLRQPAHTSLLSDSDWTLADTQHTFNGRQLFLASRIARTLTLQRYLNPRIPPYQFFTESHGKPYLPDNPIYFNMTHAQSLIACGVYTDGPIGIDAEPLNRAKSIWDIRNDFCHENELLLFEKADHPLAHTASINLWTIKEALLKQRGIGLHQDPKAIDMSRKINFFQEGNFHFTFAIDNEKTLLGLRTELNHHVLTCVIEKKLNDSLTVNIRHIEHLT